MIRAALAALLLALPGTAQADALADGMSVRAGDRERLDSLDAAYGAALRQALANGDATDIETLVRALEGQPRPVAAEALAGDWSCRTIKAGGITPLVVYDAFRCRISVEGDEVRFEKLTGSQRVAGGIHRDGDRLVLLGVGYIAGDTPPDYVDLPDRIDTSASPQITAAPGVVEMTGPDAGRILFPYPMLESVMDVLVLGR